MRAIVYGAGATGARAARHLMSYASPSDLVIIEEKTERAIEVAASLESSARVFELEGLRSETRAENFRKLCVDANADVVILATGEDHAVLAKVALESGVHVVSISDDCDVVDELLELDTTARINNVNLVVGAGFSPGLSCVLARHASIQLDSVDEIHIAKFGTGGPECARQHHRALRSDGVDWNNQRWESRRGGSGRELCWFPDPIGGLDCYQAALPDVKLLLPVFPELVRSTARVAATRRDRSTKWLPMMRRPHPEGLVGAVRAEVRGWKDSTRSAVILGALDRPAVAAGTVAGLAARLCVDNGLAHPGAGGLASLLPDTVPFMSELAKAGVRAAVFEGVTDR
jgi:saccharopine dehydrogenase-like NADP-dependent oxidoreductase